MSDRLLRLYPEPSVTSEHTGRYLADPLVGDGHAGPFIYSNFVTSLDGRIAVAEGADAGRAVPRAIANPRDWRLFQELAGRAELLITSGRYLRELSAGTAQDVLPVSSAPEFRDIHDWRYQQGMAAQPDVMVLSTTLDFPPPARLAEQGRRVLIVTTQRAGADRRLGHEAVGAEVINCPGDADGVSGASVRELIAEQGFATAYSVTGPDVLATLAAGDALDALFLTTVHRLLSGRDFSTITRGGPLEPALDLELTSLYLDTAAPSGSSQTFARYDRRRRTGSSA
jgi:riboflavin biosynthesis pyrimidine reductase